MGKGHATTIPEKEGINRTSELVCQKSRSQFILLVLIISGTMYSHLSEKR